MKLRTWHYLFIIPIALFGLVIGLVVLRDYLNPTPPEQVFGTPEYMGWLVGKEIVLGEPVFSCYSTAGLFNMDGSYVAVYKLPATARYYFESADFHGYEPVRPYSSLSIIDSWQRGNADWKQNEDISLSCVDDALEGDCEGEAPSADMRQFFAAAVSNQTNYFTTEFNRRFRHFSIVVLDLDNELLLDVGMW